MNKELIMNLQMFAADDGANGGGTPPDPQEDPKGDDPKDDFDVKGLTEKQIATIKEQFGLKDDDDVDDIVKSKHARWQSDKEKAIEEAQRLAKMNEEEKREFEYEKLQEELAELKRKDAYYGLSREASKMLAEHDIQANDGLLQVLVQDDAEGTQQAVNGFVELFNAKVEQGVKEALSGRTPKAHVNANQVVTQEEFNKMGYSERVALKQKDENLYNKLKGE